MAFTSVSVNVPVYLRWLEEQCKGLGVLIRRAEVKAISDVVRPGTVAVVNATGLGSLTLEDVKDTKVEPIRGQIVLVRAPVSRCVMDASPHDEPTRSTYIIPRPNSGGQTICGGCYEVSSTGVDIAAPRLTNPGRFVGEDARPEDDARYSGEVPRARSRA